MPTPFVFLLQLAILDTFVRLLVIGAECILSTISTYQEPCQPSLLAPFKGILKLLTTSRTPN